MGIEQKLNLNQIVSDICNKLLKDHKLITIKNVQDIFSELYPLNSEEYLEENFINSINIWRISKIHNENYNFLDSERINLDNGVNINNSNNNSQENYQLKKDLSKYKREIQLLQAKIKSINSCYNRQRQEFILRIQRMLYQANENDNIRNKK